MMMTTTLRRDAVEARVAQLETQVAALRAAVACLQQQAHPAPSEPVSDAAFLRAVAAAVHGCAFSARELVNHATVDGALHAALRGVTAPKKIGNRLHRLTDQAVGGLCLRRVDRDRFGCIWVIVLVDD